MPALPTAAQRRAELAALIAQDPTGTGGTAQPTNMLPSWQQWSQANPLPQAAVTPPAPPPAPPIDPNSAVMPTYDQQQDQAVMPPGPVAAADPRRLALAQAIAQAQGPPGPIDPAAMGGPRVMPDFPLPGRKPLPPVQRSIIAGHGVGAGKRPAARPTQVTRISESDRLNAEELARHLRAKLARA